MNPGKKIYFASDFHLGIPNREASLEREKCLVRWLTNIESDALEIFLVGDLFDFWFEYKYVVPKGHLRLLGKLCELNDKGIKLHLFHGNHDLWQFGYFETEIGCHVHPGALIKQFNDKIFYIAHGDGLGPGQGWFKFILSIYRNRFFQRLFAFIHPDIGIAIANWFSYRSKMNMNETEKQFLGDHKEYQVLFAREEVLSQHVDYFIFGHRHIPFDRKFESTRVINLGEWFSGNTYAVFDGENIELKRFEG